jgi:chromosomal replication initiation ATPase DnaA
VIGKVAETYKVANEKVLRGVRGKENEARKVAMYLVRRCCDETLVETARLFGLGSYGAVGWGCHGVRTRMEREKKFREQIERIAAEICQQDGLLPKRDFCQEVIKIGPFSMNKPVG